MEMAKICREQEVQDRRIFVVVVVVVGGGAAAAKAVDEVDAERDRATPATSAALEAGVGGKVRSYAVVRRSTRRETERFYEEGDGEVGEGEREQEMRDSEARERERAEYCTLASTWAQNCPVERGRRQGSL